MLLRFWFVGCWKIRLLLKLTWLGVGWWLTILLIACAGYKRIYESFFFFAVELSG